MPTPFTVRNKVTEKHVRKTSLTQASDDQFSCLITVFLSCCITECQEGLLALCPDADDTEDGRHHSSRKALAAQLMSRHVLPAPCTCWHASACQLMSHAAASQPRGRPSSSALAMPARCPL